MSNKKSSKKGKVQSEVQEDNYLEDSDNEGASRVVMSDMPGSDSAASLLSFMQQMQADSARCDQEKDKLIQTMMDRLAADHSAPFATPVISGSSTIPFFSKVPSFRTLDTGEDVEAYFGAFEAHMEYYDVPQTQWSRNLGPILNPDANLVYMAIDTTDRKSYSTLKPATLCSLLYIKGDLPRENEAVTEAALRKLEYLW